MARLASRTHSWLCLFLTCLAALLSSAVGNQVSAQDEGESCACFSFEEVEAIFAMKDQLASDGGSINCQVSDYSVEFTAEVSVFDQNFASVARVNVSWSDYAPGRCGYQDATADPAIDRMETWPHPAPEAKARACLEILSRAIAELDTAGRCTTYP